MASIYISYTRQDKNIATALGQALVNQGYTTSIDTDILHPGIDWRLKLRDELKKSDAFIAIITEQSAKSPFVISEIGSALAYAESGGMAVIPVVIGNLEIPAILSHIQSIFSPNADIEYIASQVEAALSAFAGRKAAEEKKQFETKERIEANAADFIKDAIEALDSRQKSNRFAANAWYSIGFLTLVTGVGFSIYSLIAYSATDSTSWVVPTLVTIKSLVVIGLLIACAKYSFMLGRGYMGEALKCSDRTHAISFGEFYLRAFRAVVQWGELKEVFQHWNIDRVSTFSEINSDDFDPKYIEALRDLAKAISDIKGKSD